MNFRTVPVAGSSAESGVTRSTTAPVPVNNALVVGVLEGIANLPDELQGVVKRYPPGPQTLPQVHALDVLHDEIGVTVALAEIVDSHNARMVQLRQGTGLSAKAFRKGGIGAGFGRQDLHGHQAIQVRLQRTSGKCFP